MATTTSWQDYTKWGMKGNTLSHFIIFNKEDGCVWSSDSENFGLKSYKGKVTQEDGSEADVQINEEAIWTHFAKTQQKPTEGYRINEEKYTQLRLLPRGQNDAGGPMLIFKKSGGGGCACITDKSIVLGLWEEAKAGQNAAACNKTVEDIANHLRSVKY